MIWLVFRKELLETLRDKRTLLVNGLLPICLYPLLALVGTQWLGAEQVERQRHPSRVGVAGARWDALERALVQKEQFVLRLGQSSQSLSRRKIDVLVQVPHDYAEALKARGTVSLRIAYDSTRPRSVRAKNLLEEFVAELRQQLLEARLAQEDLPASFSAPLAARPQDVASTARAHRHLLSEVVPLLIVLIVLLGTFYPAIDLTAGEKERGTLETLLVAPVPRLALIVGKFLVVATMGAGTGLLNLGSLGLTIALGFGPAFQAAGIQISIPWGAIAMLSVGILFCALFFASIMIAVAAAAKGFKEAQYLLSPVYFCCVIPVAISQFARVELTPMVALLPVVNVALLVRQLVQGNIVWLPTSIALLSTAAYSLLALRFAASVFQSERLLFAPDPEAQRALRRARGRDVPTTGEAALLLLIVVTLLLLVGQPLQARNLFLGLLVSEWLAIFVPVVLALKIGRLWPRTALGLNRASRSAAIGALLAGLSGWYVMGILVQMVQQHLFTLPRELLEAARAIFLSDRGLAIDLLLFAFSPAVCEELLFRGFLLRASEKDHSPQKAILINGLLFGAFHLNIYRFLPTMLLGFVLAFIALRTRSIYPGMLFHFLNNTAAICFGRWLYSQGLPDATGIFLWPGLACAALFTLGMLLVSRARS